MSTALAILDLDHDSRPSEADLLGAEITRLCSYIYAAREKVRVAHALADLPKIALAFEKGKLSYSKVRP